MNELGRLNFPTEKGKGGVLRAWWIYDCLASCEGYRGVPKAE